MCNLLVDDKIEEKGSVEDDIIRVLNLKKKGKIKHDIQIPI